MQITSENIKLKTLNITQINQRYLNWFKDPNVKKYINYTPKNLTDLKRNVREIIKEKNSFFFGIFHKSKHIGNLKIHNINYQNFSASLGILIGEKNIRNKGFGKKTITLIKKWLLEKKIYFIDLGVHKLNKPAIKLYKSCKFKIIKKNNDFYKMRCVNFHSKLILGTAQFRSRYGVTNKSKSLMKSSDVKKVISFMDKETDIEQIDTATNYNLSSKDMKDFKRPILLNNKVHTEDNLTYKNLKKIFKKNNKQINNIVFVHDGQNVLSKKGIRLLLNLKKLKKEKLINKVGLSIHNFEKISKILDSISFDVIQLPFNLVDRRAQKFFKKIKEKNIEIHIRSIFLQGSLLSKITTNKKLSMLYDNFDQISEKNHLKKMKFALAFVLNNQYIDKIIFGVRNFKEFKQLNSIKSLDCKLNKIEKLKSNDEEIIDPLKWSELILEKKKKSILAHLI